MSLSVYLNNRFLELSSYLLRKNVDISASIKFLWPRLGPFSLFAKLLAQTMNWYSFLPHLLVGFLSAYKLAFRFVC